MQASSPGLAHPHRRIAFLIAPAPAPGSTGPIDRRTSIVRTRRRPVHDAERCRAWAGRKGTAWLGLRSSHLTGYAAPMVRLAAASIAVILSLAAQDQRAALPLEVTRLSIEPCDLHQPESGNPRVEVRNTGQRTILAWGVKFDLKQPDQEPERSGVSIDGALTPPESRKSSLAPGATAANLNAANPCGGRVVPVSTIISGGLVTFVIFDDDTALGDEREISFAFDHRGNMQIFWLKMQAILDDATTREKDPATILALIRERMEAEQDPKFRSLTYYEWFLNALSPRLMALTTPQAVLDRFRSMIPTQKSNADAHVTRR
jgi:hypothetical protein